MEVADDSLVATAVQFEHSRVAVHSVLLSETAGSFETGAHLARAVAQDDLTHAFVLSDGLSVDGSELVRGLVSELPENVQVTGGLSGDGGRFEQTFVLADRAAGSDLVGVVGLYGDRLKVSCASLGGWDPFGTSPT